LLRAGGYLLIVILGSLSCFDHLRPESRPKDDWTTFDHQSFPVTHVVDGDTIHIRDSDSHETIIRLLGIDAPEMHDPTTGKPAHWAENATRYLRARTEGKTVSLKLEPIETRDKYDRLLAYIYLGDSDCINMDLVRDGEAYADRRFKHSYRPQFEQAENEARTKKRGLWKDVTIDLMPPWRRVWLHETSRDR
jgi:micrococcal nuclease